MSTLIPTLSIFSADLKKRDCIWTVFSRALAVINWGSPIMISRRISDGLRRME